MKIEPAETGSVVKAGSRELHGISPYVNSKAPKPLLRADFAHGTARALVRMREPDAIYYENVLSNAECDYLVRTARKRLVRSEVVDHETGGGVQHPIRTSSGMSFSRFENKVIESIENRLAHLLQWPVRKSEPLALLCYKPGEYYNEHFDYFDYFTKGSEIHRANGGNRVATLILYLSDCAQGGETLLADVGLEALPKKGSAFFFAYPNPHSSSLTRHAGRPPGKGVKWIATRWLKEGNFT